MDGNNEAQVATPEAIKLEDLNATAETSSIEKGETNAIDSACTVFGMYFPKFVSMVDQLSNKSLKRVLIALVGTPLEDVKPNLKNSEEKAAYLLGEELLKAKMVIIIDAMYRNQQQAEQLTTPVEETVVEIKGEDNGKMD